MAELPLDQAVPRFKENEDRLDTFVNSATGYTTSGGTSVQSIQQFLASIGSNGIDFVDNAKARFGTGNDLEIYHSGTESYIDEKGTGSLRIRSAGTIVIEGIDGTNSITADTDAEVSLYYDGSEKLRTTSTGIDVFGTVEFNGLSGTGSVTITDIADEDNMASNSATKLATQQSIKAYVDAQVGTADTLSEVLGLGNTTGGTDISVSANDDITFTDSSKAIFGAGSDLQIYHDASNSYIKDVGTGDLKIDATNLELRNSGGGEVYLSATANGSVALYNNNVKKLETKTGGIDVTGNARITASSTRRLDFQNTSLADTGEIASLQWDNNANFTIQGRNSTSQLKARWYEIQTTDTDARADAHVFYTDLNAQRMSIDATGIDVTGNVAVSGTVDGRDVATDGTKLDGIATGADVTLDEISAGANVSISAGGVISATASGGITNVVDDTSPSLGGNLDLNSKNITGTGNIDIAGKLTLESSDPEIFLVDTTTNVTTSIDSNSSTGSLQIHVDKGETASNPRFIVNVNSQNNVLVASSTGLDVTGDLDVNGDIGIGRVAGSYTFTEVVGGDERAGMHSNASNELIFKTGVATERMRVTSSGIDVTGTVEFNGLSGTGAVTVTDILDEDNMASNSATKLATQQSIKAYVDAEVAGIPTGDITSVVAGTGISGGGTSGAVTLNLTTAGAGAGTYGSTSNTTKIDQITLDAYGRVTAITTGGTGDINGVTAGTGLTGGGTSGTVTVNIDAKMVPATATELSSSINLNDLDAEADAGFYYQTSNADTPNNNYPTNEAGSLLIQKSAAGVTQLYQTYDTSTTELFFRSYYSSTWGSWKKVWTDGNDGAGSGLAADTLDGVSSTQFLRSDTSDTFTGTLTMSGTLQMNGNPIDNVLDIYLKDKIFHHGDTNTYLDFHAADQWRVVTGGTERLEVNNTAITAAVPIKVNEVRCATGQQLVLNAGESHSVATGQSSELVYINAEGGLKINSSPDNWASGWAGRKTTTIGNTAGDSIIPRHIYLGNNIIHNGDTNTYFGFSAADTYKVFTGGGQRLQINNTGASVTGTLSATGDVIAYSSSDRQLKDNITPIANAMDKISKLSGNTFDWNDKQSEYNVGTKDVGVIAQEVEAVLPEVVTTRDNGYKAVRYEKMIALLIEGMKEQQAEIDMLKAKVGDM